MDDMDVSVETVCPGFSGVSIRRARVWHRIVAVIGALLLFQGAAIARDSLDSIIAPFLESHDLPAVAAAVVKEGEIVAVGAVGTRRAGADVPVTIDDRFHIGSTAKAMTALLAATAVEEGLLRWGTTLGEVFPELSDEMDEALQDVTLRQMLSMTSGLPREGYAFFDLLAAGWIDSERSAPDSRNLDELRYWAVCERCKLPLESAPGEKFAYRNMNYVYTAAMLERLTGETWEELMYERVFLRLGLDSAGFGPQSSDGKIDAPLPHVMVDGKPQAILGGPNADLPPILAPAGLVHMSILDFARWAGWNAGAGNRGPALVTPETMTTLHEPVYTLQEGDLSGIDNGRYGLGWLHVTVNWWPDPLLQHDGSNELNFSQVWIDRERDLAVVAVTNIGGNQAKEALSAIVQSLFETYADE